MTNTAEMFPSNFLRAVDLPKKGQVVVIDKLLQEKLANSGEMKWILYFEKEDRGMVLNKTNARRIEAEFGDTEKWPGKSIELRREKVDFKGDLVEGIRVHPVEFDDDIPM